jgi:hypothetical protein
MVAPVRRSAPQILDRGAGRRIAGVLTRVAIDDRAEAFLARSESCLPARVSDISYRAVTLEMSEFVDPGSSVDVRFERGPVVHGVVRQCRPHGASFHLHLDLLDAQVEYDPGFARFDERYPVQIMGTLRAPAIPGAVYTITIVDVSRSGVRVRCPKALAPGTKIEVNCREAHISGEVRYSREIAPDEYHLGVQADSNSSVFGAPGNPDLSALREAS